MDDRFAPCDSDDPIEHFWTEVRRGWDIEPRAYFEKEAVPMGFRSPVEMAVHWMWKRRVYEDHPAAALSSPSVADSPTCETCVSWTPNQGDPETGTCGSAIAHWHGAGFNTFGYWYCRDWAKASAPSPSAAANPTIEVK